MLSQPQPSDAQIDWDFIMVAIAWGHPWDPVQLVSLWLTERQEAWEIASQNDSCPQGLLPPPTFSSQEEVWFTAGPIPIITCAIMWATPSLSLLPSHSPQQPPALQQPWKKRKEVSILSTSQIP